jgi:hypothetical protein
MIPRFSNFYKWIPSLYLKHWQELKRNGNSSLIVRNKLFKKEIKK